MTSVATTIVAPNILSIARYCLLLCIVCICDNHVDITVTITATRPTIATRKKPWLATTCLG